MIKIENVEVYGWEAAIRGMRNPMNSHSKSDSTYCKSMVCRRQGSGVCEMFGTAECEGLGENDLALMRKLAAAGSVHGKYRRMITVTLDITAPLYWWKEFDTYKVGTVRNSCSTMHKIHSKEFEQMDFSCEHLTGDDDEFCGAAGIDTLLGVIADLNEYREAYIQTNDKKYWWQMIQLLPSSYNQRATVQLNYEVLADMYHYRNDHKLDEWREFCRWIESLPYSELITGKER
jgi:hypothetical protein